MLTKVGRRCHGRVGRARGRRLPAQDAPRVAAHARGATDGGARRGDDLVDLRIESRERGRRGDFFDWLGWGAKSERARGISNSLADRRNLRRLYPRPNWTSLPLATTPKQRKRIPSALEGKGQRVQGPGDGEARGAYKWIFRFFAEDRRNGAPLDYLGTRQPPCTLC